MSFFLKGVLFFFFHSGGCVFFSYNVLCLLVFARGCFFSYRVVFCCSFQSVVFFCFQEVVFFFFKRVVFLFLSKGLFFQGMRLFFFARGCVFCTVLSVLSVWHGGLCSFLNDVLRFFLGLCFCSRCCFFTSVVFPKVFVLQRFFFFTGVFSKCFFSKGCFPKKISYVSFFSKVFFSKRVGAYRAESTGQWTTSSGIPVTIPPLFDVVQV